MKPKVEKPTEKVKTPTPKKPKHDSELGWEYRSPENPWEGRYNGGY